MSLTLCVCRDVFGFDMSNGQIPRIYQIYHSTVEKVRKRKKKDFDKKFLSIFQQN